MMKNKTKSVNNWEELTKFVESINPYTKTIVLVGWINELIGDKTRIRTLLFSTRNVNIVIEQEDDDIKSKAKGI